MQQSMLQSYVWKLNPWYENSGAGQPTLEMGRSRFIAQLSDRSLFEFLEWELLIKGTTRPSENINMLYRLMSYIAYPQSKNSCSMTSVIKSSARFSTWSSRKT